MSPYFNLWFLGVLLFAFSADGRDPCQKDFNYVKWLASYGLHQPVKYDGDFVGRSPLAERYNIVFRLFSSKSINGEIISTETPHRNLDRLVDRGLPFKFITHGWLSSGTSEAVLNVKNAYMKSSEQHYNIITVDWAVLANNINYIISAKDTYTVGVAISELANYLMIGKYTDVKKIHLIGHSLGAHVSSGAANEIYKKRLSRVARVTGLDPARPGFECLSVLFNFGDKKVKLSKNDADFVDVIHTSNFLGIVEETGHVDFYPNGGDKQPGCPLVSACSHSRAHEYFAESISSKGLTNLFPARRCDTFRNFIDKKCNNNPANIMGEYSTSSSPGKFFLVTNPRSPFLRESSGGK